LILTFGIDCYSFLFVLKQKRNQKIQGCIKFLTLILSETAQKITQNPTRLRSYAVQGFAIFWPFLLSFTKFYKAASTPFSHIYNTICILH